MIWYVLLDLFPVIPLRVACNIIYNEIFNEGSQICVLICGEYVEKTFLEVPSIFADWNSRTCPDTEESSRRSSYFFKWYQRGSNIIKGRIYCKLPEPTCGIRDYFFTGRVVCGRSRLRVIYNLFSFLIYCLPLLGQYKNVITK